MKLLSDPLRVERTKRLAQRTGLAGPLRWYRDTVSPGGRRARRQDQEAFAALGEILPSIAGQVRSAVASATACGLTVSYDRASMVLMQLPIIAGMASAGIKPVPILPSRADRRARDLYRQCGVDTCAAWERRGTVGDVADVLAAFAAAKTQDDLVALRWRGVSVGKYAVSTLMRRLRKGYLNPTDPQEGRLLRAMLERTLVHTAAAFALLDQWRPELVVLVDRGYTPEGPMFEACVQRGVAPVTVNAAHRDNTLMLKRYGAHNPTVHPSSLSPDSWQRLQQMPWDAASRDRLLGELRHCYESGQWYGEVGTQAHARPIERERLLRRLSLDPGKRTALLFPHIFWDATFFWGDDLYRDYEDWFRTAARAAWSNDRVNWVIKVHPANMVKNARDGVGGRFSEDEVLAELGPTPDHVTVLPADTDISTLSLFAVGDICLTVRGTVGLEAAALGLLVITAGTGRYDGLGFTQDPRSRKDYEAALARLDSLPLPTPEQVELAQRHAHGVFLARPIELETLRFRFERDAAATLRIDLPPAGAAGIVDQPDIRALAGWLRSGDDDFLSGSAFGHPAPDRDGEHPDPSTITAAGTAS